MPKKIFRRLYRLLLLFMTGACILGYIHYQRMLSTPLSPSINGSTIIHVAPGSSLNSITDELVARKVIKDAWPLRLYARLRGDAARIKAGDYRLKPQATPIELYQSMLDGDVITHSLTVVEGITFAELRRQLLSADDLAQKSVNLSDAALAEKLGIEGNLEGQFLPETYFYTASDSDISLLRRLHTQMQETLVNAWAHRDTDLGIKTPYEALILASIIEKETRLPNERPLVSGVFNRRLKKGMKLQTDPSVIYGIRNFNGNLTRADLTTDTPYNTYTRYGLPPTPIALPSKASIEAAVHPDKGNSLFFVADGNGGHVFSETYETHKKAVEALIKKQRSRKAKS